MNKTSYFGNRFASALRGFRSNRKSSKQLAVASTPAASEFEALESRILLSGIGTGLNKKQVTFIDADGDKVTVKALGKGAKFNIDLGGSTNNADIANIEIGRDGTSIGISVAPVGSFTKPTQTKAFINPNWNLGQLGDNLGGSVNIEGDNTGSVTTGGDLSLDKLTATNQKIQTQYYNLTPGYTNIGSITAAEGITEVGSIGLTAAVVSVIDLIDPLTNTGVAVGNINLSTGQVAKVDAFMATNGSYLNGYGGWVPGLHNINLYDIDAGSIAGINISGIDPDLYKAAMKNWIGSGLPDQAVDLFTGNNYLGVITTNEGGIGRLTGTNSMFMGQISLGGEDAFLGNIVLKGWAPGSIIAAEGDLTFNAKNFNGVIEVGGHLNLGLQGENGGSFFAGEGISGLRSGTTDAIVVANAFYGSLVAKGGDIADITVAGAGSLSKTFAGPTTVGALIESANKIGTIWSNSSIDAATIIAGTDLEGITLRGDTDLGTAAKIYVGGTLGLIDLATGDLQATISATTFGEVLLRGGNIDDAATLLAKDGIGDVTLVGGTLAGSLIAQGDAGIGNIDVTHLGTGAAIANTAVIFSAGDIASITAATTGATAIAGGNIQAQGTLGPIEAIAYGGTSPSTAAAIQGLTLIAPSLDNITATSIVGIAIQNSSFISTTGNIGSITATGFNGGFGNTGGPVNIISAGTVGNISGTAIKSGAGMNGLLITAQTGIENVTGTSLDGAGIQGGNFTSVTGNIQNITGTSSNPAGTGDGINGLTVKAIAGTVGNITGTAAGSGDGLYALNVQADKGIGTISGSSFTGDGIAGGTYLAVNGDIQAVVATTSTGKAITSDAAPTKATFTSIGGQIQSITATPTGVGGIAVDGAAFKAASFGDLNFSVSNLDGGLAVNDMSVEATGGTAGNGNVGKITVTNNSLNGAATGLTNSQVTATGTIGQVTVSVVGDGADAISGLQLTADSEGDETGDVTGVTATSKSGDAITGAAQAVPVTTAMTIFTGANVGPISGTVTALDGGNAIENLQVNATVGKIDTIIANTASKTPAGAGILNSDFNAVTGITSIDATAVDGNAIDTSTFDATKGDIGNIKATSDAGNAIDSSAFIASGNIGPIEATTVEGVALNAVTVTADNDVDGTGNIVSIKATSETGSGIFGVTNYTGANIGTITATVTDDGNAAISGAIFTANAKNGTIGAVEASTQGKTAGDDAIVNAQFIAKGTIGAIQATANEGIALAGVTVTADNDNTKAGDITSLKAVSATGSAIVGGTYSGANIGTITATVTGNGLNAIGGTATFDATNGNIGAIEAKVLGAEATGDAINGATFTAANITGTGADKIDSGKVGSITAENASTKATADGLVGVTVKAGGNGLLTIGNISVTTAAAAGAQINVLSLNANNAVNTPTLANQTSTIGTIEALGVGTGITGLTASAFASVGAITSTGTGSQDVAIDAKTTGALTFSKLDNTEVLSVDIGANVTTLGAITVDAPEAGKVAGLTLSGGAATLTALGLITVDGTLTLDNGAGIDLSGVRTFGGVTAGSITSVGGAVTVGGNTQATAITGGGVITTAQTLGAAVTFNVASNVPATSVYSGLVTIAGGVNSPLNFTAAGQAPGTTVGTVGDIAVVAI